jgi:hypothetical protein
MSDEKYPVYMQQQTVHAAATDSERRDRDSARQEGQYSWKFKKSVDPALLRLCINDAMKVVA